MNVDMLIGLNPTELYLFWLPVLDRSRLQHNEREITSALPESKIKQSCEQISYHLSGIQQTEVP